MPKLRNGELSKKQRGFVQDVIKPYMTGTQAALNNYQCKDATVANAISTENLQKPLIKNAIQAELDRLDKLNLIITKKAIEAGISDIIERTKGTKEGVALKAYELLADLGHFKQPLQVDISAQQIVDKGRDLSKLSDNELLDELTKRISLPIVKQDKIGIQTDHV